jgi:hypothetical protein
MEGFEAGAGRAEWATKFDPLASISPAEWKDGTAFGLEAATGKAEVL